MTAMLQIWMGKEWRWASCWVGNDKWTSAFAWADGSSPNRSWRLLRNGPLGLSTWTCSRDEARSPGIWSPPRFRYKAWRTEPPEIATTFEDLVSFLMSAPTNAPAACVLRGRACIYMVVRYPDGTVEVAQRRSRTDMILIWGSTEQSFWEYGRRAIEENENS